MLDCPRSVGPPTGTVQRLHLSVSRLRARRLHRRADRSREEEGGFNTVPETWKQARSLHAGILRIETKHVPPLFCPQGFISFPFLIFSPSSFPFSRKLISPRGKGEARGAVHLQYVRARSSRKGKRGSIFSFFLLLFARLSCGGETIFDTCGKLVPGKLCYKLFSLTKSGDFLKLFPNFF